MSKKVLFISHDASRTGAPIFLLHFLRWLKANTSVPFEIVLRIGGELEAEFRSLAPAFALGRPVSTGGRIAAKLSRGFGLRSVSNQIAVHDFKNHFAGGKFALIYSNTVTNTAALDLLSGLQCPVICHVHELDYWIRHQQGVSDFNHMQGYVQHYIAASEAVKRNLVESHGVPEQRIDVVHEFIPVLRSSAGGHPDVNRRVRAELGIPGEAFVIGAGGTIDWRKGADLFVQLAGAVYRQCPDSSVYFLWIGRRIEGPCYTALWHDVEKLGLERQVKFVGFKSNPIDYFATVDVFSLVSREDPFPLVCLEAATCGKPIICFDRSGGAKEFVEDDCGFVVPYLDIETMAKKVVDLLKCPVLSERLGKRAAQKVRERHDVGVGGPKILKIIERFI